ncbi:MULTISPECIES: 2,3-dihydro-2,3-dihydroxybenzoate dehydrogenase [unclassified Streptomyces]|uniref:2,3-dihydro-2,3-dihydroxybenzoate dehydrogenase n=1 Tax=unclassified Streptomyces TaxID=2593676 RepID=UPI0022B6D34A|nr:MULTISPECIES: 2,3-dihydro-2,3-dihydroxybenzoate dehydrogenase [unclassified Streptomyces]MCZ7417489.1 2,3-dihydro-2,3-dihydroxybenzoate dehydrogenase [Streptomyces sp. WMMC897]MCZ7432682.1 2,3-dihydro-2,3-dihydroxybenzoate dehydrogenase [Streptomyces sp. WMMC1477]
MQNKVALVTGAAGGIGAAVVQALAGRGVRVAAVDRDAGRLHETVAELAGEGHRVEAFSANVADSREVETVVDAVRSRLGPVDFLVNVAGVLRFKPVLDLTDEDWRTTFGVNADGVFHMSRAVVRAMVARGGGAVVTVASNSAAVARTGMAAYGASKAAATLFTKSLGLEVAGYGIRCNVVAPGSTDTPMLTGMWDGDEESNRKATVEGSPESFKGGIPLGKLALPRDVANAVVFLLSDEAGHITLHELTVDGGATLGA